MGDVIPLREARRHADHSRESLAAATGIGVRTIYAIEHEQTVPRRSTRNLLALALHVKPGQIDWPTETMERAA
ncbi:MAG: transcriptional regulator, family [Conexibacter sp.]|nr:transcriptional regulator, family [Conexibacter sp.]